MNYAYITRKNNCIKNWFCIRVYVLVIRLCCYRTNTSHNNRRSYFSINVVVLKIEIYLIETIYYVFSFWSKIEIRLDGWDRMLIEISSKIDSDNDDDYFKGPYCSGDIFQNFLRIFFEMPFVLSFFSWLTKIDLIAAMIYFKNYSYLFMTINLIAAMIILKDRIAAVIYFKSFQWTFFEMLFVLSFFRWMDRIAAVIYFKSFLRTFFEMSFSAFLSDGYTSSKTNRFIVEVSTTFRA